MTAFLHTLPCGMRLIHLPTLTQVAYCGLAIDAGTRDERPEQYGVAHFVEHMLFKGTRRRRAWHILNRMEAVGGDLNAYTNKEETVVHAAFMREHLARAVELIADIVFNSTFPQTEMEREREVIVEEIDSYRDNPAELIYDDFENTLYDGHALGHDILGRERDIRTYTPEDLRAFTRRHYRPERMTFFVMGDYVPERVVRIVERVITPLLPTVGTETATPPERQTPMVFGSRGERIERIRHTHQAHVMVGCPAYGSADPRRTALYFLNNILGGPGMNSRLNIALRERRGLVYTVESVLTNYTDTSLFTVYFGCDPSDVDRCLRLLRRELDVLMQTPLTQRQFDVAMRQIRGQIGVACDNSETYALDVAKSFLHYNQSNPAAQTLRQLAALTPEHVHTVAGELFHSDNLTTLIYR